MTNDNYEIIPHQLLSDLQHDVEALKNQLASPNTKMNELILEIESMKESVHELTTVFQKALEHVRTDGDASANLRSIGEKLEAVVSQNETIARGMVAISDKGEEFVSSAGSAPSVAPQQPASMPTMQHSMGGMPPPGPTRTAPRPTSTMPDDFPPPPPGAMMKKKRGLF